MARCIDPLWLLLDFVENKADLQKYIKIGHLTVEMHWRFMRFTRPCRKQGRFAEMDENRSFYGEDASTLCGDY